MTSQRPRRERRPQLLHMTFTLTLTLILTTMPNGSEAFFGRYTDFRLGRGDPNYYQQRDNAQELQKLKDRVSDLENFVPEHLTRLEVVEHVVTDIGRQECETGEVIAHTCSDPAGGMITCITSPVMGTMPFGNNMELSIPFNKPFMAPPVMQMTTRSPDSPNAVPSGIGTGTGINCSTAEVKLVSHLGITFTWSNAFAPCPMPLMFSWYACPPALFQPDQGLPLSSSKGDTGVGASAGEPEPEAEAVVLPSKKKAQPLSRKGHGKSAAVFGKGRGGGSSEEEDDK